MTKFASIKKLINLKRKQRHIIKFQRRYNDINAYVMDLILVSSQIRKLKKKLKRAYV